MDDNIGTFYQTISRQLTGQRSLQFEQQTSCSVKTSKADAVYTKADDPAS